MTDPDFYVPGQQNASGRFPGSDTLPHICVARAAAQPIPNAAFGPTSEIVWDTVVPGEADPAMWTAGADVTLTRAGLWQVNAHITWPNVAGGARLCSIYVNGVEYSRSQVPSAGAVDFTGCPCSTLRRFAAGSLLRVRAYQTSGAPLNTYEAVVDATWISA